MDIGNWYLFVVFFCRINRFAGDFGLAQAAAGHAFLQVVAFLELYRVIADVLEIFSRT